MKVEADLLAQIRWRVPSAVAVWESWEKHLWGGWPRRFADVDHRR
jgi:hypothetical protein